MFGFVPVGLGTVSRGSARAAVSSRVRSRVVVRCATSSNGDEYKSGLEPDVQDFVPFARENESKAENEERIQELLMMLEDEDPRIRLRAVVATHKLSNEEAEPILCKVFDSGESEVQNLYYATLALGYKPNPRSYDILMTLINADVDEEIRANALAALGYLADPRAVPTLIRAIYEETHWTAKCAAAVSLGIIKDPAAYDALMKGMKMDRPGLQDMLISCIGALGEIGNLDCVDEITSYSDSDNFIVRQTLAEALGNLPCDKSRETLNKMLGDSHQNVAKASEYSIQRMNSQEAGGVS